ncbi:MAG: MFS transporter [Paludibacteraceae bacterium]|nr:MFS transporter [Paludibacteraceae bacterium]
MFKIKSEDLVKAAGQNPWYWVPTLYFAEGVPYFLVNTISVMMFSKMGVPNGEMSFFTTLLYFPWFLKALWGPLVDVIKTKRWWIVGMQALMAIVMIVLTITLPKPPIESIKSGTTSIGIFSYTLIFFIITAFASATHDIAADGYYMLAHDSGSQATFIGIRATFYRIASVFGQGVLVVIAGMIEDKTGNIPLAWQLTMAIASLVLLAITVYHSFILPRPASDLPREDRGKMNMLKDMEKAFVSLFQKKGILLGIVFLLLYRLPEGFLIKLCQPFLIDPVTRGGLGLSTHMVGIVYGTTGVIALLVGGIVGGLYIHQVGLKKAFWWMATGMTLPCLTFVYLAMFQPTNIIVISIAIAIEQFGYGFGFTAYTLYMMYLSEGEFSTSNLAICTAFQALSMMLPGFVAGYIQEAIGYIYFFWMVIACSIATIVVTYLVRQTLDPNYGKK